MTTVYGGVAVRLPANQAKQLLSLPGVAAVQEDTLNKPLALEEAPAVHRRPDAVEAARRAGPRRQGRHLRRPRLRHLAGAPDARGQPRPRHASGRPERSGPPVQLRRQPADAGHRRLRVQPQGHRRPGLPRHVQRHQPGRRGVPRLARATATATAPTRRRPPRATTSSQRADPRRRPGSDQRCRPRRLGARVQGLRREGLLQLRLGRRGPAGHRRRRQRHQLLDLRRRPTRTATRWSWPSSTPTTPASSSPPPPATAGPAPGTTDHHSPWVTTVAASTMARAFSHDPHRARAAATSATFEGTSLTQGVTTPTPIVMAEDVPGYGDALCQTPLPAGVGRRARSSRASAASTPASRRASTSRQGGAVGMILYNPTARRHRVRQPLPAGGPPRRRYRVPRLHGRAPGLDGLVAGGQQEAGAGRRHGGVLVAWPGRAVPQAGHHGPRRPGPRGQHADAASETPGGPPGEYFQAIAGHVDVRRRTSRAPRSSSRPRTCAGRPGAIKSALMTTATTDVVKEDETTPADPFDDGAGRVDLDQGRRRPRSSSTRRAHNMRHSVRARSRRSTSTCRRSTCRRCRAPSRSHRTATNVSGRA